MIVDKIFINNVRENQRICIPEELEAFFLDQYGEEPFPYEYTEQDLYEQIRKLIYQYQEGRLDISVKSPLEKIRMNYSYLQQEYADAMAKIKLMESENIYLKDLLQKNNIKVSTLGEEADF
jgi:hypothetical protein